MNIQKISLRDVVFSGRHGATAIEKDSSQAFSVDLEMTFDAGPAIAKDRLKDTIDYYDVAKIVRKHVEGEHSHVLLENLVHEITKEIADVFSCISLEVSVRKPQVPFGPAIATKRTYFSKRKNGLGISFEEIHRVLIDEGVTSFPFLDNDEREALLAEVAKLEFIKQPEMTESGVVREDLSHAGILSEGSLSFKVADRISLFISELANATGQEFSSGLPKPDVRAQKYEKGSFGITPHRDEKKYRYVICLIPLVGKGTLALCDDREGSNPRVVDTTPGNLILMRAPGYANQSIRPMHFLSDITEERLVLGVRFAV